MGGYHTHSHHDHSHGHSHDVQSFNTAFIISITLNLLFTIVQATYAIFANSMSLLADAGHNLGDVLGLVFAWIASLLLKRRADTVFSYGYKKATVHASLINAVILFTTCGILLFESVSKFIDPEQVAAVDVMVVATLGIIINGATAMLFMKGAEGDLNIKGAFLHLLYDALISFGVVVVGALMLAGATWFPGYAWLWERLDPLGGLVITIVIVLGTWGLLKESVRLVMDAVPSNVDLEAVRAYLGSLPGVVQVHDLHIWGLSTRENALTCHMVVEGEQKFYDNQHQYIRETLAGRFNIHHVTIQTEAAEQPCQSC